MQKLKEFLTSNKAKTLYWQFANLAILFGITMITDLNWIYAPVALPFLNGITKFINQNYL